MILYIISLIPLANAMRVANPGVLQPWYAENASMRGTSRRNAKLLHASVVKIPYRGYFPEPVKS